MPGRPPAVAPGRPHPRALGRLRAARFVHREGLRQLALAGELGFNVDRNSRTDYTVRYARHLPGTASLRVTEGIPGTGEVAA